ncbi:MAG: AtpZ/AtpI family protein [Planctomycetaceae bacterium]
MVEDPTSRRRRTTSSIAQAYRDSHEVMSAALSVAVCVGGGCWLDQKFGYQPVLTICGLVLGCTMAVASLRQLLVRLDRRTQQKKNESSLKAAQQKETSNE